LFWGCRSAGAPLPCSPWSARDPAVIERFEDRDDFVESGSVFAKFCNQFEKVF
jgi:hypothetical protein